jgi:hypothetical protein
MIRINLQTLELSGRARTRVVIHVPFGVEEIPVPPETAMRLAIALFVAAEEAEKMNHDALSP